MKLKYILIICAATLSSNRTTAQITLDEKETSSVAEVTADKLEKNSTLNPYDSFYGLLPGLSVLQQVEWGANPSLILRGSNSPLIVVDGYVRSLEYISNVEIESVKILKDGAATAIWGQRGSKGVIMVTTKRGKYKSKEISVNYNHGMDFPINQPEMADGYTYALARNEALHYDGLPLQYSQPMLDALRDGSYPDLFANTDWAKEALRNHTTTNQLDITFRGGSEKLRYFTSLSYKNHFGILNEQYTKQERYNSQLRKYELNLRMNMDIDLTPTTLVKWTMFGSIKERTRPKEYTSTIFPLVYNTPSAVYPVKTSGDRWGGNLIYTKNPIATFADQGYFKENPRVLQTDLRIIQDLASITPGLSAELAVAYDNYAVYKEEGAKTYAYEVNTPVANIVTGGDFETISQVYGTDAALSVNCWGMTEQNVRANLEGKINYERTFGQHTLNVNGMYQQEYYSSLGRNNTTKRMAFIGMAGYNFANKYMLDATVAYAGTSRLPNNRYRAYPALSMAWLISKEKFMNGSSDIIDFFKLRASWGQAGNDNIDYELEKAYWASYGSYFFTDGNLQGGGLRESTLPMSDLTLERVNKYNIGIDMRLLKKLSLTADAYIHKYRDALIDAGNMYSSVFGNSVPKQNIGRYDRRGFEMAIEWQDRINKDFNYYIGANISRSKTKVLENGEGFKDYPYMSAKGLPIGQLFGLEAIGYFQDEEDIAQSPEQTFSAVRPGDIKYKDQNNDNIIDSRDVVAIGHSSSIPEWYGGLQLGFEYKGFGLDLIFQGAAGWSKQLNTSSVYRPLQNNTNISMWYLEDKIRWTEKTKDIANVPRLSTLDNANNYQTSTQWLEDGSYLKLRNVNIYYNLPQKWIVPLKMKDCKVYVRGNNLFSLDHISYLNVENMTLNYPDMFSVYAGVNIKF